MPQYTLAKCELEQDEVCVVIGNGGGDDDEPLNAYHVTQGEGKGEYVIIIKWLNLRMAADIYLLIVGAGFQRHRIRAFVYI